VSEEQRIIKFRTWHKQHGMIYPDEHFSLNAAITGNLDFFGSPARDFNVDDFTFMQYIGLHDAKWREIYEGDIVRINHPFDRTGDFTNAIGQVFWWGEEGGWYHSNDHGRPPKRMWQYVEVIGNIYENPDLLERSE
jgi:uncharacterized phage protein (TIGR01671 family)